MADRPLRFEPRMTDAEALMWTLEKDPALRSAFLQITLLDRPLDFSRLQSRLERAVHVLPRLRQRVVPPPLLRMAPPEWADDPGFDLDFHVRRIGLPQPGSMRQLLDAAATFYEDPFDRARPLWTIAAVEGLDGDRGALLVKMHHTITDGVGGVRLSMEFLDLSADAPDPPKVEAPETQPERSTLEALTGIAGHTVRRQAGAAVRAAQNAVAVAAHPQRIPELAVDLVDTARSVARQAIAIEPARSPLWAGKHGSRRRFDTLSASLDGMKRTAKALGGTVNDVFVTAIAGGAAAYHRAKGAEVDELRMAMPISRRDDSSAGGNAFAPSRVLVPAGLRDPVERFAAVHERLAATKTERALGLVEGFAGVINGLPTALLVRVGRQIAESIDFATSNLRGAPFDLWIAGAHVEANHPMGPTAATAFNATAMSYRDAFDVGLSIDVAAVDDPTMLRDAIDESFRELLELG
jgi:diacylglycerol O-acyltransferase / wax synthase